MFSSGTGDPKKKQIPKKNLHTTIYSPSVTYRIRMPFNSLFGKKPNQYDQKQWSRDSSCKTLQRFFFLEKVSSVALLSVIRIICSVFFRYIANLQHLANSFLTVFFLKKYLLSLLSKKMEILQHFQELMVHTLRNFKRSCQQKQFLVIFFKVLTF